MGLDNIEKKSLGYRILRTKMKFWHDFIYYRKFTVIGAENIPIGKPMIFTPNHQNALMDALALGFSVDILFVFLARADIFKNPKIAAILYFLKILPIYRERDGNDFKQKSDEIFKRTVDIISDGAAMVILPEGNHSRLRRLRPLKKGFARMAFKTEESNNFELDIHIVPVGIDYDNFFKYRSSLIISFGKPVKLSEFTQLYKENQAIALNKIKERLSKQMAPLIPNIQSKDHYDTYNEIRVIYRNKMADKMRVKASDPKNRILLDKKIISEVEIFENDFKDDFNEFSNDVSDFVELRNKSGLTNKTVNNNGICTVSLIFGSLSLLGTLPIFIYGFLNNILPYWIPIWVTTKFNDEQFRSSVKFVVSALSFPLLYIIQSIIFFIITNSYTLTIAYVISLPISAILSWKWSRVFLLVSQGWNYAFMKISNVNELRKITTLYSKIINKADQIIG